MKRPATGEQNKEGFILNAWGEIDDYYFMPARKRRELIKESLNGWFPVHVLRGMNQHEQVRVLNKISDIHSIIIDSTLNN